MENKKCHGCSLDLPITEFKLYTDACDLCVNTETLKNCTDYYVRIALQMEIDAIKARKNKHCIFCTQLHDNHFVETETQKGKVCSTCLDLLKKEA